MKELIFSTNNAHKLGEVQALLEGKFALKTLRECGITEDIPETAETLEGNALLKARYVHERTGADCFADDTGLEVEALGGAPGVRSARYAGDEHDFDANNALLLKNLEGESNRKARFRTVIALILGGKATIDIWSEQLATLSAQITEYRINYLKLAKAYIEKCFFDMTGDIERPTLKYVSSAGVDTENFDVVECQEKYRELYFGRHDREIGAGATLWGIHKDDIEIELNGKAARFYCSQGQQRSIALAMKLAEGEIIKDFSGGDYPVFLLDDVFSELDSKRREYLTRNILDKQVIVTCCERLDIDDANVIIVENGKYMRV